MDQTSQNPPTSAPAANQPMSQSTAPTPPAAQPSTAPVVGCKCPTINESDWDKKKKVLNKSFYKTFSPRIFYIPFSFAIDVDRAKKLATRKGYQIPANPMVLSEDGMFWGSILVEVTGTKAGDSGTVNLNQEVYTKVSKRDWKDLKTDMSELNQELGQAVEEVYCWYTSCPKCKDSKVVKTVLIAVPQAQALAAAPPTSPSASQSSVAPTISATPQPPVQPQPPAPSSAAPTTPQPPQASMPPTPSAPPAAATSQPQPQPSPGQPKV